MQPTCRDSGDTAELWIQYLTGCTESGLALADQRPEPASEEKSLPEDSRCVWVRTVWALIWAQLWFKRDKKNHICLNEWATFLFYSSRLSTAVFSVTHPPSHWHRVFSILWSRILNTYSSPTENLGSHPTHLFYVSTADKTDECSPHSWGWGSREIHFPPSCVWKVRSSSKLSRRHFHSPHLSFFKANLSPAVFDLLSWCGCEQDSFWGVATLLTQPPQNLASPPPPPIHLGPLLPMFQFSY